MSQTKLQCPYCLESLTLNTTSVLSRAATDGRRPTPRTGQPSAYATPSADTLADLIDWLRSAGSLIYAPSVDFYERYAQWCDRRRIQPLSLQRFVRDMVRLGYERWRTSKVKGLRRPEGWQLSAAHRATYDRVMAAREAAGTASRVIAVDDETAALMGEGLL